MSEHGPHKKFLRAKAEEILRAEPERLTSLGAHGAGEILRELALCRIELEIQGEELRKKQQEAERAPVSYGEAQDATELEAKVAERTAELVRTNELLRREIEGRRKMEEEVRHFASFPELSPNPVIEIDPSGTICYVNPAMGNLFPEMAVGLPSKPWVEDFEALLETFETRPHEAIRREVQINGTWWERAAHYIEKIKRIRIYWLDIHGRKQIELRLADDLAALTRLHRLSTKVVEKDGIDSMLREIIDAAVEIVGARRGTLQLVEDGSLRIVAHHGHEPFFLQFFADSTARTPSSAEVLRRGERMVVEDVEANQAFSGTETLLTLRKAHVRALQSTPMRNRAGDIIGILTTHWDHPYMPDEDDLRRVDLLARQAADLLERVRINEELRLSRDELELRVRERTAELSQAYENLRKEMEERERLEAELRQTHKMEAIGTLAGGIAHDFNNMLAIIMGNAELALDDADEDVRPYLSRVIDASKRSRELVKQILAFSRKEAGKGRAAKIAAVIEETYGLLRASLPTTIHMKCEIKVEAGDPCRRRRFSDPAGDRQPCEQCCLCHAGERRKPHHSGVRRDRTELPVLRRHRARPVRETDGEGLRDRYQS